MDRHNILKFTRKPALKSPNMVCGFNGWVDGGEVATGTVRYLVKKLTARKFAEIPAEKFQVFQISGQDFLRPEVKIKDGLLKEVRLMKNEFYYVNNAVGDNDLILLTGPEPNLYWEEYAENVLSLAADFDVQRIYLLGGMLGPIPYTAEPNVSCTASTPKLIEEMRQYNVTLGSYEGPGSFGTLLTYMGHRRGIPTVSFMAISPYYPEHNVILPRYPKSIRALARRLKNLLGFDIDISDLDIEIRELEKRIESMANRDPEFRTYVSGLEKQYTELSYEEPLGISADEAISIAEEFLKKSG